MTHFVLEYQIPLDIWRELKTYLVHDIKTQGRHLKKNKDIINFNNALCNLPRIEIPRNGPRIVYSSVKKNFLTIKYLYHVQAFKPKYHLDLSCNVITNVGDGKLSIIVYKKKSKGNLISNRAERDKYKDYYLSHQVETNLQ
jgi:hypothetical protein